MKKSKLKEKIVAVRFSEEEVRKIDLYCGRANRSKVLRKIIMEAVNREN